MMVWRSSWVSLYFLGYTTDLLTDAKTYANHAGRPGVVETSDVELAVQTRSGYEFTEGAPKDVSLLSSSLQG